MARANVGSCYTTVEGGALVARAIRERGKLSARSDGNLAGGYRTLARPTGGNCLLGIGSVI